ncbi:hypothetical protein BGZ65_001397 [Modicella reniformis]|uniref:Uncharacterized protein n=1 Tax=Modicella reniformis TaxID=1440133 RepID=A0A9P6LTC8_9FUNG|nr:hypothetical protein BGZ65_001397 [Modicella reniformis]
MAVAVLSKKKFKDRSNKRSPSSRMFEEEDEDMAIIRCLEKEPWQPDLLLERRQSDNPASDLKGYQKSATTMATPSLSLAPTSMTTAGAMTNIITNHDNNIHQDVQHASNCNSGPKVSEETTGFQGVIPVITKSPSSVISEVADTIAESDYVESIADVDAIVVPPAKIRGIEEYLQHTHQEQQLLQQQQQEIQMQLQMQKEKEREKEKDREKERARVREKEVGTETRPSTTELQLQYQLPAQLQSITSHTINDNNNNNNNHTHVQQHRNSFHGQMPSSSMGAFLGVEERGTLSAPVHPLAYSETLEKVTFTDDEDVSESLQSLKNITMLALDGLLQQVVSDVTASDPIHNPDETTIQARALIRRQSNPLLDFFTDKLTSTSVIATTAAVDDKEDCDGVVMLHSPFVQRTISDSPIAGIAFSSLERLDELARKVDRLTTTATVDEQQQQKSNGTALSSSSKGVGHILREPVEIPVRQPQSSSQAQCQQQIRLDPQLFESEEYQLACALAAMLACIYRILDRMQQPQQHIEEMSRAPRRHVPFSPERKAQAAGHETSTSIPVVSNGTNSFMKTINKQVRTLRSRRTQSTSHIEVGASYQGTTNKSLQGRLLGGLQSGSSNHGSNRRMMSSPNNLHPEDIPQLENARELEKEWSELDKLMDDMTHMWRFLESQQQDSEEAGLITNVGADQDNERNPFHDRHQALLQPQQQQSTIPSLAMNIPCTTQRRDIDQLTLDMSTEDDPPLYDDDIPEYRFAEKSTEHLLLPTSSRHLTRRTSSVRSAIARGGFVDDEKTRIDLNNVMSAIERLSKVAPRLDNQRVQLSLTQKKQKSRASIAHTIERLSRDRWDFHIGSASASASASSSAAAAQKRESIEKHRDLDKLINQIVDCANKASNSSFTTAQRAEFSPKQQWKLESARVGDRIERGEKLRMSDQDWQSPEKILLKDMTRLTNALYQQSASARAFATQRYILTDDKARNIALHGIISKIERVTGRRMENQDALPPSIKPKIGSPSSIVSISRKNRSNSTAERSKELQEMLNQVMESGGGPTRKSAMASQRAQFCPKH